MSLHTIFKKTPFNSFFPSVFVSTLIFFCFTTRSACALDREAEDAFCKSKLAGTVSYATCEESCPGGARDCAVIQTHKAEINRELAQDLKCYGCTTSQSCYDLGLIYDLPDCINCERNPFKKCVKEIPIPVVGGAVPLPKDSDGFQCWDCIDDPDTCGIHWPGTTEKPACEAACKKKNHKCVLVGRNPDNGYNCYRCADLTPPEKCTDKGFIYKAQCNTCPPGKPKCVAATTFGFFFGGPVTDEKGEACYECVKGPRTCEEQGLPSKCAADEICKPAVAPNGAKCCTCEKKPKSCKDYKLQDPPCICKKGYYPVDHMVDKTPRKKMKCCECEKDVCYPDLKQSDCKACEARGGKCEPITRERGKPQCYRCVMPPPEPKSCEDLKMPESCSPDPCYRGFKCEMADMGRGFECAECVPDDSVTLPNHCENHPTHKQPSCAVCYQAQMSCDQVKVSDNPPLFCAKCLPPVDQRCPNGMIEGTCVTPWCVGGLKCVDTVKNCHVCVPNEDCAPGRYRTAACDNKCIKGKEECRRIEGCEFSYGSDPGDLAVIDQMDPEDKYCGPDITEILLNSLKRIKLRVSNLSDNEKGAIDGTMFLDKNGMSIDLRAASVTNSQDTQVCPSKPCMAGTMKSVMICGQCVMEHIGNDILYGFISNQLDVPFSIQLAGAHYAEYTSYGGLDPLSSQAAYRMGNDVSERMGKDSNVTLGELCDVLNKSKLRTGVLSNPSGFELMGDEQGFLKDCKPCKFTKTKVMKDFSAGDWNLEDGGHDTYTPPKPNPDYCCYACFPTPTDYVEPPMTPVSGVSIDPNTVMQGGSFFDVYFEVPIDVKVPEGGETVDTEIVPMELKGTTSLGEVTVPVGPADKTAVTKGGETKTEAVKEEKKPLLDSIYGEDRSDKVDLLAATEILYGESADAGGMTVPVTETETTGLAPSTEPLPPKGTAGPGEIESVVDHLQPVVVLGSAGSPVRTAKKTCKDLGFDGDFDACVAVCKDKEDGMCARAGRNDDYDTPCWKCKKAGEDAVTEETAVSVPSSEGIDPDLSSPRTHEVVLGASHQLTKDFTLGLNFNYQKRTNDTWDISLVQDKETTQTTGTTPGGFSLRPTGAALEGARDAFCEEEMDGYSSPTCLGDCLPKDCLKGGTAFLADLGVVTCYYCREEEEPREYIVHTSHGTWSWNGEVPGPGDFSPSSLTNFSPSSVMTLVKADTRAVRNIEKLAKLAGGGISVYSINDIADLLTDGLGKQRKFSDDCFSDFKEEEAPQRPPQSAPEIIKGVEIEPSYGEDTEDEIVVDGPVLACGRQDDKDMLAVFDANGANVQMIPKEELGRNPDAAIDALRKAEGAYQKFLELKRMTPQGLLQTVTATLTSRIAPPRQPERKQKKKKKEESKIEPNDPLYWPDYGVKKSKVKERMKKVTQTLGSGLRMGGVTLGGGAAAYEEKKSDINDQWGLRKIGFTPYSDPDSAWNMVDTSKPNVVVAVIDSGLDLSHPDGPEYVWTNRGEVPDNGVDDDGNGYVDDVHGWNFLDNNNDLRDFKGHGTFVAGIIAAKANNGIGIAGINPGAVILPLRVLDENGSTNSFQVFRAINYAINAGARVMNISIGGAGVSRRVYSAINRARKKGIFVAVASGNEAGNIMEYGPSGAPGAFAVGALNHDGTRSTISNWGANNGLIAPGEEIYSLRSASSYDRRKVSSKTEFYYMQSGTSFSSPMVAATASLMLAKNPALTAREIEDILQATATDMYEEGWDGESGAGLLNAAKALRQAPGVLLTVKLNKVRVNKNKKGKLESVDIFGTVRGEFESFDVEAGKGKHATGFKRVAGPFKREADNDWIARIDQSSLKGSRDWIVSLNVKTKDGSTTTARALFFVQ